MEKKFVELIDNWKIQEQKARKNAKFYKGLSNEYWDKWEAIANIYLKCIEEINKCLK